MNGGCSACCTASAACTNSHNTNNKENLSFTFIAVAFSWSGGSGGSCAPVNINPFAFGTQVNQQRRITSWIQHLINAIETKPTKVEKKRDKRLFGVRLLTFFFLFQICASVSRVLSRMRAFCALLLLTHTPLFPSLHKPLCSCFIPSFFSLAYSAQFHTSELVVFALFFFLFLSFLFRPFFFYSLTLRIRVRPAITLFFFFLYNGWVCAAPFWLFTVKRFIRTERFSSPPLSLFSSISM